MVESVEHAGKLPPAYKNNWDKTLNSSFRHFASPMASTCPSNNVEIDRDSERPGFDSNPIADVQWLLDNMMQLLSAHSGKTFLAETV